MTLHRVLMINALSILALGDSKTAEGTFQTQLVLKLGDLGVVSEVSTIATAGYAIAEERDQIDAHLAASTANPTVILSNFGANDVAPLPPQAEFEADYNYVLDAIHAKWPAAKVYLMRAWRRGEDADCDTIAAWIDNIVAAHPGVAFIGPDERVFLENGDNGVTYTRDGIHPTAAGYALTADEWIAVMGY